MLHGMWGELVRGRVHPLAPGVVLAAGMVWLALGHRAMGAGVGAGALLAYVNGVILSRRVDLAVATGSTAGAMAVMQLGLLMTLTVIGAVTVVLIRLSLSMAVASAAGFAAAHLAILSTYYFRRARTRTEAQPT